MADNHVIQDILKKIEREKNLITGYMSMSKSTENAVVQAQADNQIREARRNINYFESTLRDLQMKQMNQVNQGVGNMSMQGRPQNGSASGTSGGYRSPGVGTSNIPYSPQSLGPGYGRGAQLGGDGRADYGPGGYSDPNNPSPGPNRGPFPPSGPASSRTAPRPNYSRLDLIKYDTPHLGPKIQYMLSQIEFKLSVEKQYKDGIEKIMGSYRVDGDRKIRKEAESRLVESVQKLELLKQSLKRYEDLHIIDIETDAPDDDSINTPSMRKPLSGELYLQIHAVSDVTHHRITSRFGSAKAPETFVSVKIEDEFKIRTRATRTERWPDEVHSFSIDKGNEIELTVFDRGASEVAMPIGVIWIRISDLVDEIRRKKIESELQHSGWVAADRAMESGGGARPDLQFSPPPGSGGPGLPGPGMGSGGGFGGPGGNSVPTSKDVVVDGWFALEPVGRIHLSLGFTKQTRERRPFDAGLNRKGAIRQRKEEVHELYGHKFIEQQFYNIMRCALCGELLKYATGMQCSDCKYMCHEKCYPQVVTKCISKSNAETDPDEAKLNHRIPHRFEAYNNIGANWCCHCGYILPLGRKSCRRCKECKLTCHAHCQHLVPDFCGMPMKEANKILREIEATQSRTGPRTTLRPGREPRPNKPPAPTTQKPLVDPERPPLEIQRLSYGDAEDIAANPYPPQSPPINPRNPGGVGGPLTQQGHDRYNYDTRPTGPPRTDSSTAAYNAAAEAIRRSKETDSDRNNRPPRTTPSGINTHQSPPPTHPTYTPSDYVGFDHPYSPPVQPQSPAPPRSDLTQPTYTPSSTSRAPQIPPLTHEQPQQPAPESHESRAPAAPAKQQNQRRIGLDHFNFLAVLGKGNFGKVMLAETKSTKKLYAIKVLKKEFIIENDEVESTRSERDVYIIANKARHPFLLNLHACFQTETRVYFVMEYISGGDLMLHIQRGQFGTKRAQFYAAEVCSALKYFHENGVVYRDLKLDNILLTLDGHIKIADYGLCKKDMYYGSTTRTFCGTPEFMAPEILLDKPYGRSVDWWAFGVLIYQMLLQQSPFRGEDEDEIYDAILADEPLYPIHMPRDSVSILQKLLTREPELRLGSGPTDAQEIMSHAFFRNINWDDLINKRLPAPFQPQIKSATDTSNFDTEFTSVTPVLTPVQSVLTQAMQEEFRGFSYSADFV